MNTKPRSDTTMGRRGSIAALLVLLATACESTPTGPSEPFFFEASIGGQPFISQPDRLRAIPFPLPNTRWSFAGSEITAERFAQIFLVVDTLRIGQDRVLLRENQLIPPVQVATQDQNDFAFFFDSLGTSTMRITSFDPINRRISGTFRLQVRLHRLLPGPERTFSPTDSVITVSGGRFNLPIDPPAVAGLP